MKVLLKRLDPHDWVLECEECLHNVPVVFEVEVEGQGRRELCPECLALAYFADVPEDRRVDDEA